MSFDHQFDLVSLAHLRHLKVTCALSRLSEPKYFLMSPSEPGSNQIVGILVAVRHEGRIRRLSHYHGTSGSREESEYILPRIGTATSYIKKIPI